MNKKNIVIISIMVVVFIVLISLIASNVGKNKNDGEDTIKEKESVVIAGNTYEVFSTTELLLDTSALSISDLNNISKLNNLEKLDISSSEIDDVSFLSNLNKLNSLKIRVSSKITDYSALKNLTNLFSLEIYGNIGYLSDMSFLSDLNMLSTLYLTFEKDRDVSFISDVKNLSVLSLDVPVDTYDKINKLLENTKVIIKTHGSLSKKDLTINNNEVEDGIIKWSSYNPDDTYVISINITDKYSDIDLLQAELNKLSKYKKLTNLTISADENYSYSVNNFDFLSNLTNLESLTINYLNSNDLSGLSKLTNLKKLTLINGNMANSKFSVLSDLTNIEELNLSMQNVSDITFIKDYKKLVKLNLSGNNITDISVLGNLDTIRELYIGCNKNLRNINSIGKLVNLTSLMITLSKFDSKILSNLNSLENLYLSIDYDKIDDLKKQYPDINIELLSECV